MGEGCGEVAGAMKKMVVKMERKMMEGSGRCWWKG